MRFRLQLILLIQLGSFFHQLPAADLNWNLGLSSWTGRGNQLDIPYDYTENYLTFNADLATWSARFELEYSQPPEYGYEFTGLRRFWLTYSGDRHTLEIVSAHGVAELPVDVGRSPFRRHLGQRFCMAFS